MIVAIMLISFFLAVMGIMPVISATNINLTAGNITEDGYVQLTFEWERDTTSTEILASDSGDQYGFIEFDTSAIPDGATINSVKLRIYADNQIPAPQDLYVKNMSGKKLSDYSNDDTGNGNLANDISGASSIGSESLSASTAEWVEITLDSNAETYLQNQLGDDYFMVGLTAESYVEVGAEDGSNDPVLIVDYSGGGGDTTPPACQLISAYPSDISANSTGIYEVIINCTDASGINTSRYVITRTVEGGDAWGVPNYWSIRPPANDKAEEYIDVHGHNQGQILKADGRFDNKWYDSLFADNYSYAVNDMSSSKVSIINGSDWALLNFTWDVESSVFRSSVFLSRGHMEKENKKIHKIYFNNPIIIKGYDLMYMRNDTNYSICVLRNFNYTDAPNFPLRTYYCNNSYNISEGGELDDSPNCVHLYSLTTSDLDTIYYSSRNSSYSKTCFSIINNSLSGIKVTENFYFGYYSKVPAGKSYNIKYVNGSSGTNVSFNETKVAWYSDNDGDDWIQANFTPDIWFSGIVSGDQIQVGVYAEDLAGNNYTNLTLYTDDIGFVNLPITTPDILAYYTDSTEDEFLNRTYSGVMTIKVGASIDPNGIGSVNHSLYLTDTSGSIVYTINSSFYSPNDYDINVTFNTSLVADGTYKINVTAIADDNPDDVRSFLTENSFEIDNVIEPNVTNLTVYYDNPYLPHIIVDDTKKVVYYKTYQSTNSSDYWDNLDTPADINGSEFWYNHTDEILSGNINLTELGGNISANFFFGDGSYLTGVGGGGDGVQRTASFTICANDTINKTGCDIVCSGSSDEDELNDAIKNLTQGGRILLREGSYNMDGQVSINTADNLTIEGQGISTFIYIDNMFYINKQRITIKNLHIYTTYSNAIQANRPYTTIDSIYIRGSSDIRGKIYCSSSYLAIINSELYGGVTTTSSCWYPKLVGNSITEGTLNFANGGMAGEISANYITNLGNILLGKDGIVFTGNRVKGSSTYIYSGCYGCVLTGNTFSEKVDFASDSKGVAFTGNNIYNTHVDLNGYGNTLTGNNFWVSDLDIEGRGHTVTGNSFYKYSATSIEVDGGDENLIASNSFIDTCKGANNTYYNIHLKSNSNYNKIANNHMSSTESNTCKYGIYEQSGEYNIINDNYIINTATLNISIEDSGSNYTILRDNDVIGN
ncbi:MAG: hypothetical protein ACTSPV_01205 [Candidatus Hodarchaeales archaeon]